MTLTECPTCHMSHRLAMHKLEAVSIITQNDTILGEATAEVRIHSWCIPKFLVDHPRTMLRAPAEALHNVTTGER